MPQRRLQNKSTPARARSHEAHVAPEDIPQLGQLIRMSPTQEHPAPGTAYILCPCPLGVRPPLRRASFPALHFTVRNLKIINSLPFFHRRSRRIDHNDQRDDCHLTGSCYIHPRSPLSCHHRFFFSLPTVSA